MATILKFRRYSTAALASVTGAIGELIVDTDKDTITVHDGTTAGGKPLATESYADGVGTSVLSSVTSTLGSYYTSTQTNSAITTALSSYYTSTQTNSAISTAVNNLVDGAPAALNTLNELAAALGNNSSYAATITTALSGKAPLASPTFTGTVTIPSGASIADLLNYAPLASPTLTGTPSAPTPSTTDNTTKIATTAFAQALVQAILPAGVITMWSGSVASIPSGWVLCNGSNGTPDLRNRFIVGAGGSGYSVGDNGGYQNITLTTTELPAHTHTGTTTAGGGHSHFIANGDTVNATTSALSATNTLGKNGSQASTSFNYLLGGTATAATQGLTSAEADHTHTFTTGSEGTGSPFDNRPPYYALAYIMKTYS